MPRGGEGWIAFRSEAETPCSSRFRCTSDRRVIANADLIGPAPKRHRDLPSYSAPEHCCTLQPKMINRTLACTLSSEPVVISCCDSAIARGVGDSLNCLYCLP
jgi:hypothetical protein